jgi:LytTr DNA-binding domain
LQIAVLARPLSPLHAAIAVAGVSASVAIYCVGYSAMSGQRETLASAFGWAVANIAPWLAAIELLKRQVDPGRMLLILGGAAVASLLLGTLLLGSELSRFEIWRRVPALLLGAGIALVLLQLRKREAAAPTGPIPVPATRIDWVRAAGNYIELKIGDRVILHRTTLSAAERELGERGFVRIHRSILVRRDHIARFRGEDVVLRDGTHLKVGKRYRSALAA